MNRFFSDVAAETRKSPDGKIDLVFRIVPKAVVKEVRITGNEKYDTDKLREQISLSAGGMLNDKRLIESANALRKFYADRGHNDAKVDPRFITEKDGSVIVEFRIRENLKQKIAGVIFICMYFLLRDIQLFSAVMLLCAVVGFVFAITNGVPMRTNTVDNDGYNTLALARSKDAMRAFWIQLKVSEKISKDVRLKDMPEEWFAVPSDEAMQNSMIAVLGVFACSRLMDQQQFEKANELMAHMFDADSNICGIHRNLLICDRIYIELITKNRQEHLAELFSKEQKKFMRQMQNFPSVLRTQYAYALLCEHDVAKAEQIKTQFQKCARVYPYPNEILSEKELMEIAKKHA